MLAVRFKSFWSYWTKVIPLFVLLVFIIGDLCHGVSVEEDLSLTDSEWRTLQRFRKKVFHILPRSFMKQDLYLIRWLRARDFDIAAAEKMLRNNLKWRKAEKIDGILKEDWSDILRDYPAYSDTHDKQGRPVAMINIGDWDIRAAVVLGRSHRLLRFMYFCLEYVTDRIFQEQAKGLNVTQFTMIGNANGFNLVEHGCPACIPIWVRFVEALEDHYVGWLHEYVVIDAPPTINVILDAIDPFLSSLTSKTFRIFGANKKQWMAYLDKNIDRNQRPPEYGGTNRYQCIHIHDCKTCRNSCTCCVQVVYGVLIFIYETGFPILS